MFPERQLACESECIRFAFKIKTVAILRRNGGKHFHGRAAGWAADQSLKGKNSLFSRLDNSLQSKLARLTGQVLRRGRT